MANQNDDVTMVEQVTPRLYIQDGVLKMHPIQLDNVVGKPSSSGTGNMVLSRLQGDVFDISDPDSEPYYIQFMVLRRPAS